MRGLRSAFQFHIHVSACPCKTPCTRHSHPPNHHIAYCGCPSYRAPWERTRIEIKIGLCRIQQSKPIDQRAADMFPPVLPSGHNGGALEPTLRKVETRNISFRFLLFFFQEEKKTGGHSLSLSLSPLHQASIEIPSRFLRVQGGDRGSLDERVDQRFADDIQAPCDEKRCGSSVVPPGFIKSPRDSSPSWLITMGERAARQSS